MRKLIAPESIFAAGSVSKQVTAAAVRQQEQPGTFSDGRPHDYGFGLFIRSGPVRIVDQQRVWDLRFVRR